MLNSILDFAKNSTPTILICLCLVIIIMLLLSKADINFAKLFRGQNLTQYKVEGAKTTLDSLAKQLDTIAGNHLHELPEMNRNITAIQQTVNKIQAKQALDSERLAKVEGYLKINI
jgi:hypothetical protein